MGKMIERGKIREEKTKKLQKIGKIWQKLAKIGKNWKNWKKLEKITNNWQKSDLFAKQR